ncbi:MAG: diacylglycerol kinase family protein [Firmicutes bacterium]|nr:diacylglycerol kinase family protein [Bacillota bacterium]
MKPRNSFWAAFGYAGRGVWYALRRQRNLRVHVSVAMAVVWLGWVEQVTPWQWGVLTIAIVLVLSFELMNTAVEAVVDLASPGFHLLAKAAKDASAGAVLISAAGSVAMGFIVFLPQLGHFGRDFMVRWHETPWLLGGVMAALAVAYSILWGRVPIHKAREGGQNRFGETP